MRLSKTSRRHLRRSAHCVGRCSTIGPWGTMLVVVRFPPSRDCSTQCKSAATIVGRFARQAYHGTHTRLQNDGFACRHRKGCRHSCLEGSFLACVSDDCGMLLRLVWWCRHCFGSSRRRQQQEPAWTRKKLRWVWTSDDLVPRQLTIRRRRHNTHLTRGIPSLATIGRYPFRCAKSTRRVRTPCPVVSSSR